MKTTCPGWVKFLILVTSVIVVAGCKKRPLPSDEDYVNAKQVAFEIYSGSENKDLEPILNDFAREHHVNLTVVYKGSIDLALALEDGTITADAVWPASSLWISLGDRKKQVKDAKSIAMSPVVFGIKKSVASSLGWVNNPKVTVADLLSAAEAQKISFSMTSATQSNSGASAYLGFLSAFAGKPEVLTLAHVRNTDVQKRARALLATIGRSAGSSGDLKDMLLKDPDEFDGMVNYEAMIIEANRELTKNGREPLCAIYPFDGLTIADFPLGYVERGDPKKREVFESLQAYLLSPPIQKRIEDAGRRTGMLGSTSSSFNPDWCLDTNRVLTSITVPEGTVIQEALETYQTLLRKPSFTIYVLDFSGSMVGEGDRQLKNAMRTLLDPGIARRYFLQPSAEDIHIVIPFSDTVFDDVEGFGNEPAALRSLRNKINAIAPNGGTDMYAGLLTAFEKIEFYQNLPREDPRHISHYFPAIILMSDGVSNGDASARHATELKQKLITSGLGSDIRIYSIMFGQADASQLNTVSLEWTRGQVFDGTKDLIAAFKKAKGYN